MAERDETSPGPPDPRPDTGATDDADAARARRSSTAERVLAAAEERDAQADARDVAADQRDGDASKRSFVTPDGEEQDLKARRSAAIDREDSKSDRTSAASDRTELSRE